MKRAIVRWCVFLVLGATINVAVAWLFVKEYSSRQPGAKYATLSQSEWSILENLGYVAPKRRDAWKFSWDDRTGDATLLVCRIYLKDGRSLLAVEAYAHVETGWPLRSLSGERIMPFESARGWQNGQVLKYEFRSAAVFPASPLIVRPLRLQPFGFFVNSLLYAAALWMLLCGRRDVRRWQRHWKKQCVGCGYPIGVSDTCTECGQPVSLR